jgi:hypothetical protein
MPRLTSSNQDAIDESVKSLCSLVTLIEMTLDPSNPDYVCDYYRDLTVDGTVYVSGSGFLGLAPISEDSSQSINSVNSTWGGIEGDEVSDLLDFPYIDKPFIIKKQFVNNDTGALVGDSFMVFDGRIDQPVITHDFASGSATLSIVATSHWSDFARRNGRSSNDSEQKSYFSSDSCFEHAIDYNKEITWGQA